MDVVAFHFGRAHVGTAGTFFVGTPSGHMTSSKHLNHNIALLHLLQAGMQWTGFFGNPAIWAGMNPASI
jgi:hypothetical protein